LRKDAHLLLATLLWGNVASNVLLALFAESVLSGMGAFLFSTIGITFLGEIMPQAYLAKNILKVSIVLVPIFRVYQVILYPLAKPTALLLDRWLGKEKVSFFSRARNGNIA
jgi:metal transporter CNNM